MPVAFTQEIISQAWDAAKLRTAITNKMAAIGWTQEYASGNDLFFSIDAPTTAPKDRVYCQLSVSQLSGTQIKMISQFGDGFSSNALQNISPSFTDTINGGWVISYSAAESFPVKFCTFISSEIKWLLIFRSDSNNYQANVGIIMPTVKPTWWDNSSVYAFHPSDANATDLRSPLINLTGSNYGAVYYASTSRPNALNPGGTRDLIKRILLVGGHNTQTVLGMSSTDLGFASTNNLSPGTQFTISGETWVNISSGVSGGLCVRIA